jgi:hypothetical protein
VPTGVGKQRLPSSHSADDPTEDTIRTGIRLVTSIDSAYPEDRRELADTPADVEPASSEVRTIRA